MMGRRVGRPGLVGTMARTAVIAGTAQAVTGNVARRQQARAMQDQAQAAPPQQAYAPPPEQAYAPPPPEAPAAAGGDDMIAQLSRLGDLHAQGILDDAEFAAAKARLLG